MKVAVGGFHHETNTFAPEKAVYQNFVEANGWPALTEGENLFDIVEGVNLGISGFINASMAFGHSLIPLLWCSATPSSHVTADAFERVAGSMLGRLANSLPVDAVYLDLHGAMVTEHSQDGEGELLERVRRLIGPQVPLIASLDLHANITTRMVLQADALVAYRTYPHVDMADTGRRTAILLERIMKDKRPAKSVSKLDFLIPLIWQSSLAEPCRSLYKSLEDIERRYSGIWSLSFATGFPPSDIHEVGPAILAYADDQESADHAAHELAESVLSAESEFQGKIYAPDEAVRYAMGSTLKPVVIADTQDNPGAGGNSDTIGMLRALVDANAHSSVIGLIYDPESAQLAHQAGEGQEIEISLGARSRWDGETPFKGVFRVQSINDGRITGTGPMFGGARMELGPMAALKIGGIEVLVSSKKMQLADQAIFHHLKIEPSTRAILVLKSSVHFRADFSGLAGEIIIAASPGPNAADNLALPFQNVRPTVRLAPGGPTLQVR